MYSQCTAFLWWNSRCHLVPRDIAAKLLCFEHWAGLNGLFGFSSSMQRDLPRHDLSNMMFTPRHGTWNRSGGKGNSLTQQHLFFGIRWYYEWYVPLQARVKNDDDQLNLGLWLPSWGKLLWPWRHQFTRCTSPGSARPSWNIFPRNVKLPSIGQDLSKHHSVKRSSYGNGTNLSYLMTFTSKKWVHFSRLCKFNRWAVTSWPCLFAVPKGDEILPSYLGIV